MYWSSPKHPPECRGWFLHLSGLWSYKKKKKLAGGRHLALTCVPSRVHSMKEGAWLSVSAIVTREKANPRKVTGEF